MEFYKTNVVGLILVNISIFYFQRRQKARKSSQTPEVSSEAGKEALVASDAILRQFNWRFLPVYVLVFGADWLQGPYIYTMYKDEKNLTEEVVAYLFTTGFLSSAIGASFLGHYADLHGRRKACLYFCIIYSLSCLSVLSSSLIILFLGRILGGLATVLMYSVFESWMVTEYHRLHIEFNGGNLSEMFGTMTLLNGAVAIVAGIWAQEIADLTGTQAAPFMSSICLLTVAFVLILNKWTENYGDNANAELIGPAKPSKNGFKVIWADKRLIGLGIASFAFEGSMYLWIFFKFPALKLAHRLAGFDEELQFGMIFAALMCSMMLGSMFFNFCASSTTGSVSAQLLVATMVVGSACFVTPVFLRDEWITFWCFCLFEVCCGVYFPSIAHQKEKIIDDGVRANIYGILRVPFNIFVVVGLSLTQEGESHRDTVFMVCGSIMLLSAVLVGNLLVRESRFGT